MNKGDKVEFWLTVRGKPIKRVGVINGFTYSGLAEVVCPDGYRHKINKTKLKLVIPVQLKLYQNDQRRIC